MIYAFTITILTLIGVIVFQRWLYTKRDREYELLLKSRSLEEYAEVVKAERVTREEPKNPGDDLVPLDQAIEDGSPQDLRKAFKSNIEDGE